jgi:2',3'-cyclic-nucleotide 2'-phosphodiesterase (5'-nucleotidase family)
MLRYQIIILILRIGLTNCQSTSQPKIWETRTLSIDSTLQSHIEIEAYISPLRDSLTAIMNEVIGSTERELFPKKPGTPLSNIVDDLLLEAAGKAVMASKREKLPMISVINIKGLRASLPKGKS